MSKTIKEWMEFVKKVDTRTLLECRLGLHSFMSVLGFSEAFKGVGLDTMEIIIKGELEARNKPIDTIIFQLNPYCKDVKKEEN